MHEFDIEKLYQKMIDIANDDGVISSDEQQIIENVRKNIEKYYQVLKDSFSDEVITSEDQDNLYRSRKSIMDEALKVAKADDKVTQEEFSLLNAIRHLLDEIEDHEHY